MFFRSVDVTHSFICAAGYPNVNQAWINNEAHGGLYGVYLNKDGLPGCSFIRGFFIWKSFDFAIYFQVVWIKIIYVSI